MKTVVPVASALLLFLIVMLLPGCSAIAGIFKAGVWAGIALVGVVLLLVIFLFSRKK
ncbi:phosphatidate cytidylyltransferase [Sediminibacterium roseum]|uniref:Phosphatidate cytidylyltransferase n=1 Tax=Sediminibacterium roseum TaxID=1978412 RepID=A0ABW9ZTS2_9BACT|nr:phosphatidate cytidylyltransferase [Sediminibacterium roseum]NCI50515.1 phosphatidate cytidylyltransferase [Sediminibacterium roseum]